MGNNTLKVINFSKNFITENSCEIISDIIYRKNNIIELYLHWNRINSKGSELLFNQLQDNQSIKVFDISWNNIGGDAQILCDYIKNNNTTIHFDVSNNHFSYNECLLISESLNMNKSMYGFHFYGNYGYVDNKGFLVIESKEKEGQIPIPVRIQGINPLRKKKQFINDSDIYKNVCWVCDNWYEYKFSLRSDDINHKKDEMFIHLEFEQYQPRFLGRLQGKNVYQINCMVPNTNFQYFFSNNGKTFVNREDPVLDIKVKELKLELMIGKILTLINMEEVLYSYINNFKPYISQIKENKFMTNFDLSNYKPKFKMLPRIKNLEYTGVEQNKVEWQWISSIFKTYKIDAEESLQKSFNFDYQMSKMQKITKSQLDQANIKEIFKQNYKLIKDIYKGYCYIQPHNDIFCISLQQFISILKDLEVFDEKITEPELQFKLQQTLQGRSISNPRTPEQKLIRHQFMEMLLRYIEIKAQKQGLQIQITKQVEIFFQSIQKYADKFNENIWREKIYQTEPCDIILRYYQRIIKFQFESFCSKKVNQQKNTMNLEDLMDLCKRLDLFNNNYKLKEIDVYKAFNLSKQLEIDEISSNKAFLIQFIEFLEALARISERLNIAPQQNIDYNNYLNDQEQEKKIDNSNSNYPMFMKLESLCVLLVNITPLEIRTNLKIPEFSLVTDFFIAL